MRVNKDGRVTIPKRMRERAGLRSGTEAAFEVEGDVVAIRPVSRRARLSGKAIVAALRGTCSANIELSTDEIMKLLRGY